MGLFFGGCAAGPSARHTIYTGVPLPVAGSAVVCANATIELEGPAACEKLAVLKIELEQQTCHAPLAQVDEGGQK